MLLSTASSVMPVRPQHADPALSSQRLVEGTEGEVVPLYTARSPSRPCTRQTRSQSIGQLEFLSVSSLSSSLSHSSITSSSGPRFAGLRYRSFNCHSVEAVLGLLPVGFTAALQHGRAESSGYLTLTLLHAECS